MSQVAVRDIEENLTAARSEIARLSQLLEAKDVEIERVKKEHNATIRELKSNVGRSYIGQTVIRFMDLAGDAREEEDARHNRSVLGDPARYT